MNKNLIVDQKDKQVLKNYQKCFRDLSWNGVPLNKILLNSAEFPPQGVGATAKRQHEFDARHQRDEALNVTVKYVEKALFHEINKERRYLHTWRQYTYYLQQFPYLEMVAETLLSEKFLHK